MGVRVSIAGLSPVELASCLAELPAADVARLLRACGEDLASRAERAADQAQAATKTAEDAVPISAAQAALELGVHRSTPATWLEKGLVDGYANYAAPRGAWRNARDRAGGRGRKAGKAVAR